MANIHFIIHSKENRTKETYKKTAQSIYLCYRFGKNDKLIYPTGFKSLPKHWNPIEYRLRNTSDNSDKDKINNFLNELETVTESFITDLKISKKELTKYELKKFIETYLHPPKLNEETVSLRPVKFHQCRAADQHTLKTDRNNGDSPNCARA